MSVYPAKPEVAELANELIAAHYPELVAAGTTVLFQMHESNKGLHLHGYPAAAVVSLNPAKDRCAGLPDARIVIDQGEWKAMNDRERRALLDHELHHLEVVGQWGPATDHSPKQFVFKQDDAGRPKMKIKKHDYELGGFYEIADRYKQDAIEFQAFKKVLGAYRQRELEWGNDMVDANEFDRDEMIASIHAASV